MISHPFRLFLGLMLSLMVVAVSLMPGLARSRNDDDDDDKSGEKHWESLIDKADDGGNVRFIAFGDSGSGESQQYLLAARMLQIFEQYPFTYALALGDLIYDDGNLRDGKMKWTIPYYPLKERGVEFKAVLGNHDWKFKNRKLQFRFFGIPSENYRFRKHNVEFFALDTEEIKGDEAEWLAKALEDSTADWKIVFGHYPILSSGSHGGDEEMYTDIWPVLRDHGADVYLCGHDHDYEHLRFEGVDFFVTGGGGRNLHGFPNLVHHEKQSIARHEAYHFMHFVINDDTLKFDVHDINGHIIDAGKIEK